MIHADASLFSTTAESAVVTLLGIKILSNLSFLWCTIQYMASHQWWPSLFILWKSIMPNLQARLSINLWFVLIVIYHGGLITITCYIFRSKVLDWNTQNNSYSCGGFLCVFVQEKGICKCSDDFLWGQMSQSKCIAKCAGLFRSWCVLCEPKTCAKQLKNDML